MNTEHALADSLVLASSEETTEIDTPTEEIRSDVYEHDALSIYNVEVTNIKLLTAEEEAELSRRIIEENDLVARKELVERNLRLVRDVASKFFSRGGAEFLDIVQAGNIGLMRAVEKYNHKKHKTRFSTYAVWWIREGILREIKNQWEQVRVPRHVVGLQHRVWRTFNAFVKKMEREPTFAELVEELGLPAYEVRWVILSSQGKASSLDDSAFGPGSSDVSGDSTMSTLVQTIADKTMLGPELAAQAKEELIWANVRVKNVLEEVSTKTKQPVRNMKIFKLFYGLDGSEKHNSLRHIGDRVSLTPEGVRQVVSGVWKKLGVGRREEFRRDLFRIQELEKLVAG